MGGKLITFEGVEGAGKTTQLERLQTWLVAEGYKVQVTREPGGTALGVQIRSLLLHSDTVSERAELLLYAADRAHHVDTVLRPALQAEYIVLCDRYTDSTLAYQGYGRGLPHDLIATINQIATAGLQPDLTLWLDLDAAHGLSRIQQRQSQADRLERAALSFHTSVQQGFTALARTYPERIVRVDASQSPEQVQQAVQTALQERLGLW
ncbi:dTMP kinase [Leptolyngbya sp. FACHB-261]|uniref:dTMP kinase n=1 Tax=Leptolyngbya sp. FACHB-261 TaxID=2692806 RepID=UPI0016848DFA|nr:dTMP kinase [Leptolyngbya sp. FACHB-261]MBD2100503.1 dTMP kinase [Leptolyngbya sp. FACHB-261]